MVKGAYLFASKYMKPKALSWGTSREMNVPFGLRAFLQTSNARVRVLHIAGAAVEVDHIIGVLLQLDIFDRAEGHHVHTTLLCDGAHVAGGSMPSIPLQSIMLSNRPLPQPTESTRFPEYHRAPSGTGRFTLEQVLILHEPGIVLCRTTVKFRFHCQRVLSDFRISNLRGSLPLSFGSFFLEKLGVYLGFLNTAFDTG